MTDAFNRSGMHVSPKQQGWTADSVYPEGPAARSGIRGGDFIASINGKNAIAADAAALHDLMTAAPGTPITVIVGEGAARRTVVLTLQDVL